MVIRRLKSDFRIEKMHGLYFLLLVGSFIVSTFFMATHFFQVKWECWVAYSLLTFALLTTGVGCVDYKNPKNVHKGSFKYFINSINISKMSVIGEMLMDSDKKGDRDNEAVGCVLFFLGFVPFGIGLVMFWIQYPSYNFLALGAINLLLLILDYNFSGYKINKLKIEDEMLHKISDINDLSDSEKSWLKKTLLRSVNEKGYVSRMSLYNSCLELEKEQIIRIQKEILSEPKSRKMEDVLKKTHLPF